MPCFSNCFKADRVTLASSSCPTAVLGGVLDTLVFDVTVTVPFSAGGFSSKSFATAVCCEATRLGRLGDVFCGDPAFFLDGDFERERRRLPGEGFRRLLGDDERLRNRAFF